METVNGIGVIGALGVLFVGLKLTGYIDWSWWWVTLPFWGGFAAIIVVLFLIFFFAMIQELVKNK